MYEKYAFQVREAVQRHHSWLEECLPMIASENITSALIREMAASDFAHRYAEGPPGKRYYQGCEYIDEVENLAVKLAKELFDAPYANVQPTSGVVANLSAYFALASPGDTMMSLNVPHGGHISHAEISAAGVRGLKVKTFPFDAREMNIDVDESIQKIRSVRPKLILFGGSLFLFPHPVRELRETADEVGATVLYDAAHVLGLIAGKRFQHPLKEGADVVTSSRHKTFPGPQGGLILAKGEFGKALDRSVFPGTVSNHHLHHLAGLAIALAEMLEFGAAYADQIIKNSKALAQSLYEYGFSVLCESKGFTESHQVVADVSKNGGGTHVATTLEAANIIINKNLLPWDDLVKTRDPSGIRLGTQELTRLGMRESEMKAISEFFKRLLIDGEKVEKVKKDIMELKKGFNEVKFSFDGKKAYDYFEFF
ncbi:MAG: serine hydroxymethyltransferase [Candidatus Hydrothermarchaeaceae archaeon]